MISLRFAREYASFEVDLQNDAPGCCGGYYCSCRCDRSAVAASYLTLLDELIEIEDASVAVDIGAILSRAIAIYREREGRAQADSRKEDEHRKAARTEAKRRHEMAIAVECPYCGARPGVPCRSRGLNAIGQSKGIADHKDRYRAATDPEWKVVADAAR